MSNRDTIYVRGLRLETVIGFHDWERAVPQSVHVDLEIYTDTVAAGVSDSVKDTHDYEMIIQRLQEVAKNESYQLVEALAARITEVVLGEFKVRRMKVRVGKPGAVRGTRDVGVVIERNADDD